MQSGKAQISLRDLTFLDDGDKHVASSNGDGGRCPDHWDAEIVPAMVSTSATSGDDDGSTSEQRRPRLDLIGNPLSRPRTTVERLDHVDNDWNCPVTGWHKHWRHCTENVPPTVDRRPSACVSSSGWSVLQATTDRRTVSDGQITQQPCSLPATPTENSVIYLETHWQTTSLFNNVQIASDFVNLRTKLTETLAVMRSENCQTSGDGHQLNWLETITRQQVWSTLIARANRRRQDWDRWRTLNQGHIQHIHGKCKTMP